MTSRSEPRPGAAIPARYRHKKTDGTYRVLGEAKLQRSGSVGLADLQPMVVYQSDRDGSVWCRSMDEFHDGRFEAIPEPTDEEIVDAIRRHSSPTVGGGDIHGGQRGLILYEPYEGFVIAALRRLFARSSPQGGD